jgi:hypothetical protein
MLADDTNPNVLADSSDADLSSHFALADVLRLQASPHVAASNAVYFLHIEKTAGTSVHKFLLDRLSRSALCPARLINDLEGLSAESLWPYRLFSGHFTGGFSDFLGVPLKTVTVLRDPVQRSVSQYAHIRRDPLSEHHKLALGLSLREFCLHPDTRPLIEDYQTRFLAGEAVDFPFRRVELASAPRSGDERDQLLTRARARLASCAAVGVTENLTDTLTVFCTALGLERSGATPYENPSYNRPKTIDRDTLSIIRDLTQCDAILHKEATRMLRERAHGIGMAVGNHPKSIEVMPNSIASAGLTGASAPARSNWPEREHRIKLGLSAAICKLPRAMRVALVLPYTTYRLLVDRTGSSVRRLPLLTGILYLIQPLALPVPGHLDKAAALVVGFLLSAALSGRRKMRDLKLAAISRFDL